MNTPALFVEHICDSVLVAAGDLLIIAVLFTLLRVRSIRLRRAAYGAVLLHSAAAFLGIAPHSAIQVGLYHRSTAFFTQWLPVLDTIAIATWLVVAVLLVGERARRCRRTRKLLLAWIQLGVGSDATSETRLDNALLRLDAPHPLRVAIVPLRVSPCVVGVLDPVLLMPAQLVERLDDRELDAVLAHELAHVRSRDAAVHYALDLVCAVLWFNPLLWVCASRFRAEGEMLRDAQASKSCGRRSLATAIVKALDFVADDPARRIACTPLVRRGFRRTRDRLRSLGRSAPAAWVIAPQLFVLLAFAPWGLASHRAAQIRQVDAIGPAVTDHDCKLVLGMRATNPWVARIVVAALDHLDCWPPADASEFLKATGLEPHETQPAEVMGR